MERRRRAGYGVVILIIELIRGRRDDRQAAGAEGRLPDRVDTERHVDLLQRFGIDAGDLPNTLRGTIPGL